MSSSIKPISRLVSRRKFLFKQVSEDTFSIALLVISVVIKTCILSKIIYIEAVAETGYFFRKPKAKLVLTNLKPFDTFVFHNYQK